MKEKVYSPGLYLAQGGLPTYITGAVEAKKIDTGVKIRDFGINRGYFGV